MLLNMTDSYPANFAAVLLGLLLATVVGVTLFVLSIIHLMNRRWKGGLITLGIALLVLGIVALLIF